MEKEAKITDETKMMILNSIFEAARAGERGKGLAALANEIIDHGKKKVDGT